MSVMHAPLKLLVQNIFSHFSASVRQCAKVRERGLVMSLQMSHRVSALRGIRLHEFWKTVRHKLYASSKLGPILIYLLTALLLYDFLWLLFVTLYATQPLYEFPYSFV
jgi:hypothetical protein